MDALSKRARKLLREAAGEAYSRELGAELKKVRADFDLWEKGEISPFELENRIHKFHQGPARELFVRYSGRDPLLEVSSAVYRGFLRQDELDPDVSQHVTRMVETFKQLNRGSAGDETAQDEE